MGVSFQKQRLQSWEATIERGQVPPCVPGASERCLWPHTPTHEPFLSVLLALVLSRTAPLLLPSPPSPPFLPLPLPSGCSLASPVIFSQQFYQRPSRSAAKADEAGTQPRCSLAGVPEPDGQPAALIAWADGQKETRWHLHRDAEQQPVPREVRHVPGAICAQPKPHGALSSATRGNGRRDKLSGTKSWRGQLDCLDPVTCSRVQAAKRVLLVVRKAQPSRRWLKAAWSHHVRGQRHAGSERFVQASSPKP